uniref:Copper transporter n=1 Tax=Ascaris lumbricoides TaxID=6252 RepID=A0A0M3HU74_ASCLU
MCDSPDPSSICLHSPRLLINPRPPLEPTVTSTGARRGGGGEGAQWTTNKKAAGVSMSTQLMGIPLWACYAFGACFLLLLLVLLLDYLVIRRNALGNTCCLSAAKFSHSTGQPVHQKKSTNILLSV